MVKQIRPAAFRHTYSTMLIANGEIVKVVQELMRHSNSRHTGGLFTGKDPYKA